MLWTYYLLMLLVLLVGWFVNILGLPGLWLMVAAYGLYGWWTGWNLYVGWPSLIAVFLMAVLAEVVEFVAGAAGSAAAGGRKRGMIGAIVGGFLGAIFLSVIPIWIVAQVIGACLGAFIGAAVMEFTDKDIEHSLRVGVGAAKGRFWGIVSKLAFGCVMFLIALVAGLPYGATGAGGAATAGTGAGSATPQAAGTAIEGTNPATTAPTNAGVMPTTALTTSPTTSFTTTPTTLPSP